MTCSIPFCTRPSGHNGRHRIVYASGGPVQPAPEPDTGYITPSPRYSMDASRPFPPSVQTFEDFELTTFSFVDRCPYCGAKFGEAGTTHDGKPCSHPTKMSTGFGAVAGVKK